MVKSKTTAEKIAEKKQARQQLESEIKSLLQQQKVEEHKAMTDRLCNRG